MYLITCQGSLYSSEHLSEHMKISELSRVSGTPIPTIKFYIRRGLLSSGKSLARNQAVYDETHLERLDLIDRLKTYAELSIDTIAQVLDASSSQPDEYAAMDAGMGASGMHESGPGQEGPDNLDSPGLELVKALTLKNEWPLQANDPALQALARAYDLADQGWPFDVPAERVEKYIAIVFQLADLEISDDWSEGMNPDQMLKFAVLGTFIFEPFILALRRVAHRVRMLETKP